MHCKSCITSAGAGHTVCLISDAGYVTPERKITTLYTWGLGEDGQLGHGGDEDLHIPKEIDALKNVQLATVCCGANHTIAVTAEPKRELYAWGWGDFGRLGQGDHGDRCIPSPVTALSGISVRHVACGDSHCLVVASDGKLFSFGRNQNGQLGLGDTEDRLKPSLVETLWEDGILVRKSAGGAEHSAITVEGGTMYTFGWGRYGNLGHGHCRDLHVPTKVQGLVGETITDPVCGWRHSAALTSGGGFGLLDGANMASLATVITSIIGCQRLFLSLREGGSHLRRAGGVTCVPWLGLLGHCTVGVGTSLVS